MALTPGTWYVDSLRGGFVLRSSNGTAVVRGAGGFCTHDDALACAYVPELLFAASALLESAGRWHDWDDPMHKAAMPDCPDCAAMNRVRDLLLSMPSSRPFSATAPIARGSA